MLTASPANRVWLAAGATELRAGFPMGIDSESAERVLGQGSYAKGAPRMGWRISAT
jgi:hypothetical protein